MKRLKVGEQQNGEGSTTRREESFALTKVKRNEFLEAKVKEDDTLQAIALRFHCSIAEIKRINKIDKDNEIYAKKILKIPITPHSVLVETKPTADDDEVLTNTETLAVLDNAPDVGRSKTINDIILETTISPTEYTDENDEVTQDQDPLYDPPVAEPLLPPITRSRTHSFSFNGSDCDMSWVCLFIFILALCLAIPLIYVLYVAEHIEKYHHVNETK